MTSNKTKIYKCKNFKFPFIKINEKKKDKQYTLKFLNKNKDVLFEKEYEGSIPQCLLKLFNLEENETKRGFITEITCINSHITSNQ